MAKRSFRTLYEMMRSEREVATRGVPSEPEPADRSGGLVWRLLSPGYVLRVPAGYLLIAVAVVVLLLAIAYMLGARHAKSAAEAEFAEYMRDTLNAGEGAWDPLQDRTLATPTPQAPPIVPIDASASPGGAGGDGGAGAPERTGGQTAPTGGSSRRGMGPIESDPRQAGLWYMVIAETRREGATRLAEFCRADGLEAYVVRAQNGRFRVIVLPGLSGASDPARADLGKRIQAVGRRWKSQRRGATDLGDAYPLRYDG